MGCTASRHLDRRFSMEGCLSPLAPTNPEHGNAYASDFSVEYHHHFVTLTSSSYGLLKVLPPSNPTEANSHGNGTLISLSEMYGKLRSLELAATANILRSPSPTVGGASSSPSVHQGWRIDSAELFVSETVDVEKLMMGCEEETLLHGRECAGHASGILVSPARAGPLAARRQCKKKPLHTEEKDGLKSYGFKLKGSKDEEYDSGKENSSPENGRHSMCAPPIRSPLGNSPLSRIPLSLERLKGPHAKGGIASDVKSSSTTCNCPSSKDFAPSHKTAEANVYRKPHQKRPAASRAPAPLSVSTMTSMSRRVLVKESVLSSDPNSPLFDPNMVASYEKALETISQDSWNACLVSPEVDRCRTTRVLTDIKEAKDAELRDMAEEKTGNPLECFEEKCPCGGGGEMSLVLYTTTLRGIRKTFEDCNTVRSILRGYGVSIDERDVSMHLEFLNELRGLMDRMVCVPRLFIKGRYIGGIEEVGKLHESGNLKELVVGLPKEASAGNCEGCDGIRFVPCLECRGSCKVRHEGNKVERCPDCNENGLIQCPICT